MKTYVMLPIKRPENAPVIQKRVPIPTIRPQKQSKILYRIVALKDKVATITQNPSAAEMTVMDVDITKLGTNSVKVGDILGFEQHDKRFERPVITHRAHQVHTIPANLTVPDER
jgi:hypothetical protein